MRTPCHGCCSTPPVRRSARRWLAPALLACAALNAAPMAARAQEDPTAASTSRTARAEAVRSIPVEKLDPAARQKVNQVLNNTSVYRRLPVQVIDCDPNLYLFLVRHPEVVVQIWKSMGITEMSIERLSETRFRAADGAGSAGRVEFLYGDHETHLIYAEGSYTGPLAPRAITARCLMVLKTGYIKRADGRYYLTNRMDTFVDVDNAGVELLAKTFQSVFGRTADANFAETAFFLSRLSRTAESNADGVERMALKLAPLDANIRDQFIDHTHAVADRARRREEIQTVSHGAAPAQQLPQPQR